MHRQNQKRHLRARLRENNNANKASAIKMHFKKYPSHEIDPFDAEIIGRASDDTRLQIKEWIYTKKTETRHSTSSSQQKLETSAEI
jgi:hypothetical protein